MGVEIPGCLHLIVAVIFIFFILTSGGSTAHKVLWIFLVLVLPCLGPILYLIFKNRTLNM